MKKKAPVLFWVGLLLVVVTLVIGLFTKAETKETYASEEVKVWNAGVDNQVRVVYPRIHFVSFSDAKYIKTLDRITKEAEATRIFHRIHAYTEKDLGSEFWNDHREFVNSHSRGFGYWIWKPWVVIKTLKEVEEGDVIVYADAGCGVNADGLSNLVRYVSMLSGSEHNILGFQMPYPEHLWTKMDLFEHLQCQTPKYMNSGQIMATTFLCKKTKMTEDFLTMWYKLCSEQGYRFVDDSPSLSANTTEFKEHRHDQSIFSLLCKKYGALTLGDEVQYLDPKFPIHALRNKF